jgi:hypothetical protein
MSEVMDEKVAIKVLRGMYPLGLPAAKKSGTKPPEFAKIYFLDNDKKEELGPNNIKESDAALINLIILFSLTEKDLKRIGDELRKTNKAFVKAYIPDIALVKCNEANAILGKSSMKAEILK